MLRIKLAVVLLVSLTLLSALSLFLAARAENRIVLGIEDAVKTGAEVVKLANRLDEYSLIDASRAAAALPGLADAMACPRTEAELTAANREQTPAVDPTTGAPILDAAGRPLDLEGNTMRDPSGTRCQVTQHAGVLQRLAAWNASRRDALARNNLLFVADREPGFSIAREPDLLIAADTEGVVVARVGPEMDGWFGPSRPNMTQFPLIARAELGQVQNGPLVWREYEAAPAQLVQVAVAPILDAGGRFVGTVIVGNFLTDVATEKLQLLGMGSDMGYFFVDPSGAPVFAGTSFAARAGFVAELQSASFTRREDGRRTSDTQSFADFAKRGSLAAFEVEIGGRPHLAVARALAEDDLGNVASGFIVLTSLSEASATMQTFGTTIPITALLLFLIGAALMVVFLRTFLAPIDEISKGIQEVVAGNHDYMWPVSEDNHLSDLAHSLNVMSARLQGKPDPDDDSEGGDSNWGGMVGQPASPDARKPAGVVGLGNLRGRSQGGQDPE